MTPETIPIIVWWIIGCVGWAGFGLTTFYLLTTPKQSDKEFNRKTLTIDAIRTIMEAHGIEREDL
jgi:hypothetical protein